MEKIREISIDFNKYIFFLLLCSLIYNSGFTQELEPRAMNNVPVGTNFLIGGYGYANGNVLLDPTLPIEGLKSNVHSGVVGYVRSISLFGQSAKMDAIIPYAIGDWNGYVDGEFSTRSQSGLGDIRVRLSFNFIGSKAMNAADFQNYKPKGISGISLQVIAPTGNYNPNELINLGSNRWAFKTQWGYAKTMNKWVVESYVGLWLFTKNNDFLNGNVLSQKPLYTFKMHVIRELPRKMWAALNVGYGIGARSKVNDIIRDTEISTIRMGLIYALPIAKKHTIKFSYNSSIRFKRGPDFDAVTVSYQFRWNNLKK